MCKHSKDMNIYTLLNTLWKKISQNVKIPWSLKVTIKLKDAMMMRMRGQRWFRYKQIHRDGWRWTSGESGKQQDCKCRGTNCAWLQLLFPSKGKQYTQRRDVQAEIENDRFPCSPSHQQQLPHQALSSHGHQNASDCHALAEAGHHSGFG